MANRKIPVLIVGAGPIGLSLAGDLGWRGIECALIEKSDGVIRQAKMDMVGIRSMEYCRRWGIVPWVENAGYNREYPQDCAWVTTLNGYEFGREPFPSVRAEPCPPESPQKRERCPQNFFDPVLRRFAERSQLATLRYETELVSFSEHEQGVIATVRNVRTGDSEEIEACYLVGTDGGASAVRQALDIPMEGPVALTYTTNVIFRRDGLERLHHMKPAYRYIFIGEEGTWATLVAINGRDQWRFSVVGGADRRSYSNDELRAAIMRAVGRDFDFEILSVLPWVRRQLVASRYGTKRVFLAGDAAHLTSPTGGFGMNTGIQDAVNLSWKLESKIKGWGGDHILESYEIEQRPVGLRNVAEATDNLKRMLNPRVKQPPKELFDDTPEGAQARMEFGNDYTEMMRREWFSMGIHLGYMYENSPIIVPDGTPAPPDTVSTYTQTARPGSRAPHVWLDKDVSTLDLFGKEFVLLRFGDDAPSGEGLVAAAQERKVPLKVVVINNAEAQAAYEQRLVLVRPDGQCAWRGDSDPADPCHIVDTVRGAVARTR
ncbi:2-polyprenyl-6-methoxyphenol hydroxylase-like FAD-dependent oxidoreductase [Paraburkholderia sp. BL6665CI2N2]|uniref:FAD-dependent oxidoreductase n=1 Tax=Paraburkholderia sp. BL6665CI2N2 TaxID=1938806 RepID=UPI0010650C91|nr:FAD-dependent oxidoreductase [Paraburkholderia sp. BL6665CI2N2]TDY15827.1 2-polyprenyl-6-methoxyphenol hydroxylase-like FAD-dependent oxidoreductase [Paraburkholderia sp. BL6665CI2N2]